MKSASPPAFLREHLPEEGKLREGTWRRDAWPVSSPDRRHLVDPEPDERYVLAFPACAQLRYDRYELLQDSLFDPNLSLLFSHFVHLFFPPAVLSAEHIRDPFSCSFLQMSPSLLGQKQDHLVIYFSELLVACQSSELTAGVKSEAGLLQLLALFPHYKKVQIPGWGLALDFLGRRL